MIVPMSNSAAPESASRPATRRLTTAQRSWRVLLAGIGLIILSIAQVISTNDWFPLGSLSQYSYARPLDSPTKAVRIRALTEEGTDRGISLSNKGIGVGRAEVEGQVQRIIDNPQMLEGIARVWSLQRPQGPALTEVRMERVTRYVSDGVPTGEQDVEVLTTWTVQGDYGSSVPKEQK